MTKPKDVYFFVQNNYSASVAQFVTHASFTWSCVFVRELGIMIFYVCIFEGDVDAWRDMMCVIRISVVRHLMAKSQFGTCTLKRCEVKLMRHNVTWEWLHVTWREKIHLKILIKPVRVAFTLVPQFIFAD